VSYSVSCQGREATIAFRNAYRFVDRKSGYQASFVRLRPSWRRVTASEAAELQKLFAGFARVE
jgi:hypothetical protein